MSCFVDISLSGKEGVESKLNRALYLIENPEESSIGSSRKYISIMNDEGESSFSSLLEKSTGIIDWKGAGFAELKRKYPEILSTDGEPKLYFKRNGSAYLKIGNGNRFDIPGVKSKIKSDQISEFKNSVKIRILNNSKSSRSEASVVAEIKKIISINLVSLRELSREKAEKTEFLLENAIDEDGELLDREDAKTNLKKANKSSKEEEEIFEKIAFLNKVKNIDEFASKIKKQVIQDLKEIEGTYIEDVDEKDESGESATELHGKPSDRVSDKLSITPAIRRLLSSVPKRIVAYSDPEDMRVNRSIAARILIDEPVYEDFSVVFNKIQSLLNNVFRDRIDDTVFFNGNNISPEDIKELDENSLQDLKDGTYRLSSFEKMMDKLYDLADKDQVIMDMLINLEREIESAETEQDKQAIKVQFVSSFQKGKSQNTNYVSNTDFRFTDGIKYENILRSEPAVDSQKREIIANNFIERFISSLGVKNKKTDSSDSYERLVNSSGIVSKIDLITDRFKIDELIQRINSGKEKSGIESRIAKRARELSKNELVTKESILIASNELKQETVQEYKKAFYDYFLDKFNISLSKETVDTFVPLNAMEFVQEFQRMNSGDIYSKKVVGIDDLAAKFYQEKDKNKRAAIKEIFSNKLNRMAYIEARNSSLTSEATTLSGGEKRWLYSNLSKLHLSIIRWKEGDLTDLIPLAGKGNEFVDYLLGYQYTGESSGGSAEDTSDIDYSKGRSKEKSKNRIKRLMIRNNIHVSRLSSGEDTSFDVLSKEDMMLLLFTNMTEPRKEIYERIDWRDRREVAEDRTKNKNYFADYVNLRNVDKSKTESISNIPMGGSNVSIFTETGKVDSIGEVNIRRARNRIFGEYKKIAEEYKIINQYLSLSGEEQRVFGIENLVAGWHYQNIVEERGIIGDVKRVSKTKNIDLTSSNPEENTITREMFKEGAFRKLGFFNDVFQEKKEEINDYIDNHLASEYFDFNFDLKTGKQPNLDKTIDSLLAKALNSELEVLLGLKDVFEIETNIIKEKGETKEHLAANFAMNYLFTSIDTFELFSGELAMYKQKEDAPFNMDDPLKRTSAPNADGKYPDMTDPSEVAYFYKYKDKLNKKTGDVKNAVPFFRSQKTVFAVIKEQAYFTSEYQDATNDVLRQVYKNSGREGAEIEGSFGESLVADGQSFSDPDYFAYILDSMYGMTSEDKALHEELKKENTIINDKHIRFLKKMHGAQQSKKLQSHSIVSPNNVSRMPMFWKSSLFPLYPAVIKGLPIENMAKAMKEQGVDVVAMESAFKNKILAPTSVHNDVAEFKETGELGTILSQEEIIFNPFLIDTDSIKMQVELAFKEDKSGIAGSQPLRNIQVNMDLDSKEKNYSFRGQNYTGAEMIKIFNESVSDVIIDQLKDFLKKIDYKKIGGQDFNLYSLKKMISEQVSDIDEETLEILLSEDMPIEAIPGLAKAIYPLISKYITKKVAKPSTNSVALIQVANFGFNTPDASESNIAFVNKDVKLKPARPTSIGDLMKSSSANKEALNSLIESAKEMFNGEDEQFTGLEELPVFFSNEENAEQPYSLTKKDGYSARIKNAQILMPFSSLVFDSNVSWEEFKELVKNGKVDERILNSVVGYRIPNQSMASNDSFEIVGFLPPVSGNTAVLYHEITAKTGSNFEIDRLTMMIPNVKKNFLEVSENNFSPKGRAVADFISANPIENYLEELNGVDVNSLIGLLYKNNSFNEKMTEELGPGNVFLNDLLKKIIINEDFLSKKIEKDTRTFKVNNSERTEEYSLIEIFEELTSAIRKRDVDINQYLKNRNFTPRKYFELSSISYVDDNSKKGNQNKMIEAIQSILNSENSFDDLISPIDSPLVKDSIEKEIYEYSIVLQESISLEEKKKLIADFRSKSAKEQKNIVSKYRVSNKKSLFLSNMPFNLSKIRLEMIIAKGLVATMANQMVNLPLTQINEVFLKYDLGISGINEDFGKSHVVGRENDDTMKISKLINYLMNASVDAAKDNYIVEGNLNGYTSNAAMVLFRLGMSPEDVFKILLHPAVVRLANNKASSMSKLIDIPNLYSNDDLNSLSEKFVVKIKTAKEQGSPIKLDGDYFMFNAAQSASVRALKTINDEEVIGFWNIIMTIGKDLGASIGASNPDSKQFGVTFEDAFAKENALKLNVLSSFVSKDSEGRNINNALTHDRHVDSILPFIDETNPDNDDVRYQNYIGSVMNVNISLLHEMLGSALIETSPGYKNALNLILHNLGNSYSTSSDFIRLANKALYSYVLAKTGHKATNFDAETKKYLLEEFYKEVTELFNHEELIGNRFLNSLKINSIDKTVSFDNLSNYSDQDSLLIKDDFRQIYQLTKDVSGKSDYNFGYKTIEKFVQYSFLTTGFNNSGKSFLNKVPSEYYVDSGYGFVIKEKIKELADPNSLSYRETLEEVLLFTAAINPGKSNYKKIKSLDGLGNNLLNLVPNSKTGVIEFDKKLLINNPASGKKELARFLTFYDSGRALSRNFALLEQYAGNTLIKKSYVELKTSNFEKKGSSLKDSLKKSTATRKSNFSNILDYDINRVKLEEFVMNPEPGVKYKLSVDENNLDLQKIREEKLFGMDYSASFLNKKKNYHQNFY